MSEYSFVFIMTYGRSGSTLLQAILNSTPGVLIRGENRGITYQLHKFHQTACRDAEWAGGASRNPTHPFYGIADYPVELATDHMRTLCVDTILRPTADTRILGFKEIRWYQSDLAEYLQFMRQVFPGARFILNTRNLEEVAESSWWGDDEKSIDKLRTIEQNMLSAANAIQKEVYQLHYNDYVDDPTQLADLFAWLGLVFDEVRVREIMSHKYAPAPPSAPHKGTHNRGGSHPDIMPPA